MGAGASASKGTDSNAGSGRAPIAAAKSRKDVLADVASEKKIFDAHCHYYNYLQETEGLATLSKKMEKCGIGYAVLTGCAFKKSWTIIDPNATKAQHESEKPVHHLYDDGDLYYYSLTDATLYEDLAYLATPELQSKFAMTGCGFNMGDFSAGLEAQDMVKRWSSQLVGFGEVTLQSDDINLMTVKGGTWSWAEPSIKQILEVADSQKKKLPVIFYSDACSVTTKPYRASLFEYIKEIDMVCSYRPNVKCLWVQCGVFMRGMWGEYYDTLMAVMSKHDNLYISLTPELCAGKFSGLSREKVLEIAKAMPERCCLGTMVKGVFEASPPEAFGEMNYTAQTEALTYFAQQIETLAGPSAAAWIRYRTAATIYGFDLPKDPSANAPPKMVSAGEKGKTLKALLAKQNSTMQKDEKLAGNFISSLAYGGGTKAVCPPSVSSKKWDTIDCHLHLLDFLQKSSGTSAALKAMDGCDVKKAVVFGMPCCKKWCFYREDAPLYYQDDNGPCYVYAYADQMVADAWLALDDTSRARMAPCFASFDPTDLSAIDHIKRLYRKYPNMWRGIGEVMCRHDDLTTMLLGKEIPRVNHPALDRVYQFAIETGLPVLVHHNSDRVGDNDGSWHYVHEVEDVLNRYPKLKFVWVHAGVSRRCSEPNHYDMISRMCATYPNLGVDISWVVWEDVICDEKGVIKPPWVECFQKHHTQIYIGSDNVAQYFPIKDTSINLLASNITKYYQLFDKLTEEAAKNIAYENAQRMYFEGWNVPTGEGGDLRYTKMPSYYQTECLDPAAGAFVLGATDIDDDGLY